MPTRYTKELLTPIVKESTSWAHVLRTLGLKPTGGNYRNIQKWVRYHNIGTDHFCASWNKGSTYKSDPRVLAISKKISIPDSEVFIKNGRPMVGSKIVKRLLDQGWEYKCYICGLVDWLGKKITLHLDHINGDHCDNRKENLRFLCPNCHQQTDTWGNSKRGRTRIGSRGRI